MLWYFLSFILIVGTAHTMQKELVVPHVVVRPGTSIDRDKLLGLYKTVAAIPGGLARLADEISTDYIDKMLNSALTKGFIFVADCEGRLIGSLLTYRLEPRVFAHVLSELSVLVDPSFQGKGIGTALFSSLLNAVRQDPRIFKIELIARESNPALKLYERLGFIKEGKLEGRIKGTTGALEADIMMGWFNPSYSIRPKF